MGKKSVSLGKWMPGTFFAGFPVAPVLYNSFTGGVETEARRVRPDRYRFFDRAGSSEHLISRGGGYSYAGASFSADSLSIEHTSLNRIIAFDPKVLTLEVEAGATLGDIFIFLSNKGFYLPVQPGFPFITIGGCIAVNVHGKNPYKDGTFHRHVESLKLFHPDFGIIELSGKKEPELFELTCGGYGLTGSILSAVLKISPLPSGGVKMRNRRVRNLTEFVSSLDEIGKKADLAYSWHDFNVRGNSFGRGFIMEANFSEGVSDRGSASGDADMKNPLTYENRGSWRYNFLNSVTIPLFSKLYYATLSVRERRASLWEFFFPLSGSRKNYFKLFGKRGQMEYQVILPFESLKDYLEVVKKRLEKNPFPITLGSTKLFGGEERLLRFAGTGVSMSLDFPLSSEGVRFAEYLDGVVQSFGARPYIIKDYRIGPDTVKSTYGEYEEFRERLHAYDPKRVYRSELSERLGL